MGVDKEREKRDRLSRIISRLESCYGIPNRIERTDLLDELIRTILSQNTNDRNRDRAYQSLSGAYPTWDLVLEAGEESLCRVIKVAGLASTKSRRIIEILKNLKKTHGGLNLEFLKDLPPEKAEIFLQSFKGVGEKTAKCVLLFGLSRPVFPVDTHIFRIAKRLGIIPSKANRKIAHDILGTEVPIKKRYSFHLNLIEHGRKVCKARSPRCAECCLKESCLFTENLQGWSSSAETGKHMAVSN
jgi:endonuclease-3